jgi:hypothetical protein
MRVAEKLFLSFLLGHFISAAAISEFRNRRAMEVNEATFGPVLESEGTLIPRFPSNVNIYRPIVVGQRTQSCLLCVIRSYPRDSQITPH